jgi:hypothetical protein
VRAVSDLFAFVDLLRLRAALLDRVAASPSPL